MAALKQSFSWWCFTNRGLNPDELLATARRIGFEGVDLIPDEYWPLVGQHGLRVVAVDGHKSIETGINNRENHSRIEAELRARIEQARVAGAKSLVCFSGSRGAFSDEEGLLRSAELLRKVAPVAQAAGVQLVVELLNSKVDHPNYQCDRTSWGVRLVQLVDSPAVRLLYDIYHMQIMEGDVIRTLRANHTAIGHYHTAGNPGRGPIGEDQELNYPAIFRAIAQTGYDGYIGHEFVPKQDPAAELTRAYRLCAEA